MEGAGEYELWFGIRRSKIRFSKREFCLVTGLKFGYLSNIINEEYESVDGGIHERCFNNNPELLVKALLICTLIYKFFVINFKLSTNIYFQTIYCNGFKQN